MLPLHDGEIVRVVRSLQAKHTAISGSLHIPGGDLKIPLSDAEKEKISQLEINNGYVIPYFSIRYGGYSLTYNAQHGQPTSLVKFSMKYEGGSKYPADEFQFYLEAIKELAVPPLPALEGTSAEALAGFKTIETALAGAVSTFAQLQESFALKNQELRTAHETEVKRLQDKLQEDRNRLEDEIAQKRKEIEEYQKKLDDRSNTHARRDIRKEIKEVIKDSLSSSHLSKETGNSRTVVRLAYGITLVSLFVLAFMSTNSLGEAITQKSIEGLWFLAIKATVSGLSFLGLALLYIRWEVNWLGQQAAYERNLASTRIDIDRASWIAESLLEWNRESPNKDIPPELLESFARRLFDWDVKTEDHHSASDSLASAILGSASRLQLGPDGAQVEVGRRGIAKLKRS